jgi:glutathione synthase/RimK-type ligase-like ATP-grasp enzyme
MKKILILADNFEDETEKFRKHFEEIEKKSLADTSIYSGKTPEIFIEDEKITSEHILYINPRPEAFNYTRVLTEAMTQTQTSSNLNPSSMFILMKKPYMIKVLTEKDVPSPTQASIATKRGITGLENDIEPPFILKKYSGFELDYIERFESFDDISGLDDLNQEKEFVVIQEIPEGDFYDVLYIDGEKISLKLEEDIWSDEDLSRHYHSLSDSQKQIVEDASKAVGTDICRIRLKGEKVMDMDVRPELEMFEKQSGKNVYGRIADALKEEDEE